MDLATPRKLETPYQADALDLRLLAAIQDGLPITPHPYADIAARIGITEQAVLERLAALQHAGIIKRFGIVVRHHELGIAANAMVVWDVADAQVDKLGACLANFEFVTLCYRRPRRLPQWRYNLYCMIHGKSRDEVLAHLEHMIQSCGLQDLPHEVLFSKRRFKQRGAAYFPAPAVAGA